MKEGAAGEAVTRDLASTHCVVQEMGSSDIRRLGRSDWSVRE